MQLYSLPEQHSAAAAALGVDDVERRQHVQQIMQQLQQGCLQASQPFTGLRASGLRRISAALLTGLADPPALSTVLDAAHSQVLDVILSTLDRDLIPAASAAAAATSSSSCRQPPAVAELLAAVGRCPAGHAPAAASSEELQEAFRVLWALVLMHPRSRTLMASAQYLQLTTARACEVPACLPHATHTLLALLVGSEEAQAMFVTNGSFDMLLTRTLQHARRYTCRPGGKGSGGSRSGAAAAGAVDGDSSDAACGHELLLQLVVFLQLLLGAVIGEAVKRGAHISTQRVALSLISRHLGSQASAAITNGLSEVMAAAARASAAGSSTAGMAGLQMSQQLEQALLHRAEGIISVSKFDDSS